MTIERLTAAIKELDQASDRVFRASRRCATTERADLDRREELSRIGHRLLEITMEMQDELDDRRSP